MRPRYSSASSADNNKGTSSPSTTTLHSKKNKVVDLNELYATICAADAQQQHNTPSSRRRRRSSMPASVGKLWSSVVKSAKATKKSLLQGEIHGLPIGWGVENNRSWAEVTCSLYHSGLRMDMDSLKHLVESKLLKEDGLVYLKSYLKKFKHQLTLLLKFKDLVSSERLVYGFEYRVNTNYRDVYKVLDLTIGACDEVLRTLSPSDENQPIERRLIDQSSMMIDINELLESLVHELTICLDDEDSLLASLLLENFNEADEHEAIMAAISEQLTVMTDAIVVEKMLNAMYHWLGSSGRKTFVKCLPGKLRCVLYGVSSRELQEFNQLLKCVCAPELHESILNRKTTKTSSSSTRRNVTELACTPQQDDHFVAKYQCMAVKTPTSALPSASL